MVETRVCRGRCGRTLVTKGQVPGPGQVRHLARGLCGACYYQESKNGTLIDHSPFHRPLAVTIGEWGFLSSQGCSRDEAAQLLGISPVTLKQAIQRWNRQQVAA
jgi:hypothetical protein